MSEQGYRNVYARVSDLLQTSGYVVVSNDYNDIPKGCDCAQGDIDLFYEHPPKWMTGKFTLKATKKLKYGRVYELVRTENGEERTK